MARIVRVFSLLLFTAAAMPGHAQMPAPTLDAQKAAIEKVSGLVGEWKGEGWIRMGPGPQMPFSIEERVQEKLGGVALLVEGHGRSAGPDGEMRTTHQALAVLTWDAERQGYSFQTHTGIGHHTEADLELLDNGNLRWNYPVPGREVRYTIELTEDIWRETGESSTDGGETWLPFLEMTLKRVE